jgi:hypothetical protein
MNVKRFKGVGDLTKGYFKVPSQNLFYSNFLSYICKGQGSFEDNLWVYMGFNNFPRPTFKVTTLCQVFKRLQLGTGNG